MFRWTGGTRVRAAQRARDGASYRSLAPVLPPQRPIPSAAAAPPPQRASREISLDNHDAHAAPATPVTPMSAVAPECVDSETPAQAKADEAGPRATARSPAAAVATWAMRASRLRDTLRLAATTATTTNTMTTEASQPHHPSSTARTKRLRSEDSPRRNCEGRRGRQESAAEWKQMKNRLGGGCGGNDNGSRGRRSRPSRRWAMSPLRESEARDSSPPRQLRRLASATAVAALEEDAIARPGDPRIPPVESVFECPELFAHVPCCPASEEDCYGSGVATVRSGSSLTREVLLSSDTEGEARDDSQSSAFTAYADCCPFRPQPERAVDSMRGFMPFSGNTAVSETHFDGKRLHTRVAGPGVAGDLDAAFGHRLSGGYPNLISREHFSSTGDGYDDSSLWLSQEYPASAALQCWGNQGHHRSFEQEQAHVMAGAALADGVRRPGSRNLRVVMPAHDPTTVNCLRRLEGPREDGRGGGLSRGPRYRHALGSSAFNASHRDVPSGALTGGTGARYVSGRVWRGSDGTGRYQRFRERCRWGGQ